MWVLSLDLNIWGESMSRMSDGREFQSCCWCYLLLLFTTVYVLLFCLGANAWWKAVLLTRGAAVMLSATAVLPPSRGCGGDAAATRLETLKSGQEDTTPPNTRPSVARCPQFDSGRCHWWWWTRLPYLAKYWSERAKGIGRARPSFTKKRKVNPSKALQTKRFLMGVVVQNKPLSWRSH